MSVLALYETHLKPEKVTDMKTLLAGALSDTRAFDGCQGIDVYFNTEDSSNMLFFEQYAVCGILGFTDSL